MIYVVLRDNGCEGMRLLRVFERDWEMHLYVTGLEHGYESVAVFECGPTWRTEPRRMDPTEWQVKK